MRSNFNSNRIKMFSFKPVAYIFLLLILCLGFSIPTFAQSFSEKAKWQAQANRYLVIRGTFPSEKEAIAAQKKMGKGLYILPTIWFANFSPHYYILVHDDYEKKANALGDAKLLKDSGIDCYVKFSGEFVKSLNEGGIRIDPVNEKELGLIDFEKIPVPDFGETSEVEFTREEGDPGCYSPVVHFKNGDSLVYEDCFGFEVEELELQGKWMGLINTDYYAGAGDWSVVVLNLEGDILYAGGVDLANKKEGIEIGQRDFYTLSIVDFPKPGVMVVSAQVNFRGYSGHPGIESNWKAELGDDWNVDDPVDLGTFVLYWPINP